MERTGSARFRPFYWIAGGVVMLVTVLFYIFFFSPDKQASPVYGLSLFFVLSAEAGLFAVASYAQEIPLRMGLIVVGTVHVLLAIAVSVIWLALPFLSVRSFVFWNVLFLAAAGLIDAFLVYHFRNVARKDAAVGEAQAVLRQYAATAQRLAELHAGSPYAVRLGKIQDELRFSDNTVLTGEEREIGERLEQLQTVMDDPAGQEQAQRHLERIEQLIRLRNDRVRQMKIGKF